MLAIRRMDCSVTLADPSLPDYPLIDCSEGFERLTGYARSEVVGRNCRFLSQGACVSPRTRARLREAAILGAEFIGVLPNRRKGGKPFRNLLHMTTMYVAGRRYLLGVQADATHVVEERMEAGHAALIQRVADRIFSANFDACVQIEAHEFRVRLPAPYSEIMKQVAPDKFEAAQGDFVQVRHRPVRGEQHTIRCKNTFIHLPEEQEEQAPGLKRSASDSLMDHSSACSTVDTPDFEASSSASSDGFANVAATSAAHVTMDSARALPSVGSAGHPKRCTECRFHFFSLHGCRSGADCRFCHELHPRKNPQKMNRLLRRFAHADLTCEEIGDTGTVESTDSHRASSSTARSKQATTTKSGVAAVIVQYSGGGSTAASAAALPEFTAVLGQVLRWPARIETAGMAETDRCALVAGLTFSVEPPLPAGLRLDPRTGEISGAVAAAQPRTVHVVTTSTQATGPGGVALGAVPVARSWLSIRVADLRWYDVCDVSDGKDENDSERLIVKYAARSPEG